MFVNRVLGNNATINFAPILVMPAFCNWYITGLTNLNNHGINLGVSTCLMFLTDPTKLVSLLSRCTVLVMIVSVSVTLAMGIFYPARIVDSAVI